MSPSLKANPLRISYATLCWLLAFLLQFDALLAQSLAQSQAQSQAQSNVLAPALPPTQAPIDLNAAFLMSIEQGQEFLEKLPGWLASAYAKSDPEWRQEMLWRAGRAAWLLSRPAEQLQSAEQLEALSVSANLPTAKAYALILRSRNRQELGDYRSGVELVTQAATILSALQRLEATALAEMEFCAVYYSGEQTELALRACKRAESVLAKLPTFPTNPAAWSYAQSNQIWLLANTKNYFFITAERAERSRVDLARGEQAIALFTQLKMPTMVSMVQDNLSTYYLEHGEAAKALSISQDSLKLELSQGRSVHAVSSLMNVARAQSVLGQHRQALASVDQAMKLAKKVELDSALTESYELQMELAHAAGDLPLAIRAAQAAIAAKAQAFDEHNARAIAEMDARFQGAEQTRELERLAQERKIRQLELEASKAENAKQAARLSRNNLWLLLVTVSTAGLLIVSALFWALWRASKRHASRMRALADTDGLTQLLNRRAFVEQFSQSLQELAQSSARGALCIVDIDHFKQINDTHGHPVGDLALKRIATLIRAELVKQPNDPSETLSCIVGRLGGEEFAVWLPDADAEGGVTFAERLRQRIERDHHQADALGFPMSMSIGIAALARHLYTDAAQWLSAADRALYRAKHLGRNRCELAAAEASDPRAASRIDEIVVTGAA